MGKITIASILLWGTTSLAVATPHLYFTYSGVFDFMCAKVQKQKINKIQQKEVRERLPEFQAIWDTDAEALLSTLVDATGKPFAHKEMRVTLTVCNFVSISNPFIVNIKSFLNNRPSGRRTWPPIAFVNLTFHEFIHTYVVENLDWRNSPLLKKYKNQGESNRVLSHLHLMALQKAVYLRLGRTDLIAAAETLYKDIIKGDYARSWKIIDEIENYQSFVDEFKVH